MLFCSKHHLGLSYSRAWFVGSSECVSQGVVCLFVCFGLHARACTRTDWLAVVCSCSANSLCALDLFIPEELDVAITDLFADHFGCVCVALKPHCRLILTSVSQLAV